MKRIPVPVSTRLIMAALVGMAAVHLVSTVLLEGAYPPFALVIELPLLALAALVATGRWWATAVAAGLAGLFLLLILARSMSRLTQPSDPAFPGLVLFLVLAGVVIIAGVRATVQNRRRGG